VSPAKRTTTPTLEEVAAAAGVSRSTASRVVNGSHLVSESVRAAVSAAIEQLNYTPNRAARSLANRQTMAIALVVPEDTTRVFADPYFAAITQGISRVLAETDYVLTLHLGASEKTQRYLRTGNVDGALVVSHHSGDHGLADLGGTLPVVFGGRPIDSASVTSYYVDVDNAAAAGAGTRHLIESGRTRIATIAGPADMPAAIDRFRGWTAEIEGAGLDAARVTRGDFSMSSGVRAMRALLAAWPDIDAVFVASDLMALGALSVLREQGIRVPTDVAIVGFDDIAAAAEPDTQLTTVHQPSLEMGEEMTRRLLRLLRGEAIEHAHIMETTVVVRRTA
jgi:DNA-binding LacI/PurR family transcriptional regulator